MSGMGGSSRDRVHRTGVVALLLLVGSVVVAVVLARRYHLDTAATLVGLVGGVTGLTGLWLSWAAFKADQDETAIGELDLAGVADQLAVAVRRQWEDEAALRRLNDPYPLPVRWQPAEAALVDDWPSLVRLASSGAGWPPTPPTGNWATGLTGLAGGDGELACLLDRVPTGRLMILGEPGAGKTMLTVRLVLDLLADGRRAPGGPVPVLVSLASWNPQEQALYGWLEAQLAAAYPGLTVPAPGGSGVSRARALLDAGLILPVLDGLDEIADTIRSASIARINDAVRPGTRLVVTARTTAYRRVVTPASGPQVRLAGAAGIQLRPLDAAVTADYLRASAGGPADAARWDPLLAAWPAPVGQALSTPLMASLARTIYNPRPGEPAVAVGNSPAELLDPVRFPTRTAVELHLFDAYIPAAYRPHLDPAQRCRYNAADAERWLGFLARHLDHTLDGTPDIAWWQLPQALPRHRRGLAVGLAAGLLFGLVAGSVFALMSGLVLGLILGPAIGLMSGFVCGLAIGLRGETLPPRRAVRWHLPSRSDLVVGLAIGLTFGLIVGLAIRPAVGLAVGLGAGLGAGLAGGLSATSADLAEAANPTGLLRQDRAALLTYTLAVGLVGGLVGGLTVGFGGGLAVGLAVGLMFVLMFVLVVVLVVAFGPWLGLAVGLGEPAWGMFALTRAWLAARGQLPRDLMTFLTDAHEKHGVLRQVGPVYQFRHLELQHRLANR